MTHGDPSNPAKNPHPVKRYEVTATSDAPGPWDSISGTVFFDVVNEACTPKNDFLGVHIKPTDVPIDFKMNRVDDHTWKGYFYRDALQDDDYYNLGVCHWDATGVSVSAMAQGVRFAWSDMLDDLLRHGPETSYFKKSVYGDRSFVQYGAPDYSPLRPEYKKNPNEFFPVTIAVKEVAP